MRARPAFLISRVDRRRRPLHADPRLPRLPIAALVIMLLALTATFPTAPAQTSLPTSCSPAIGLATIAECRFQCIRGLRVSAIADGPAFLIETDCAPAGGFDGVTCIGVLAGSHYCESSAPAASDSIGTCELKGIMTIVARCGVVENIPG